MATLQDVQNEIQSLKEHVATETGQVAAKLKALEDEIVSLKDQVANGGNVSEADLDAIVAKVREVETNVDAIVDPISGGSTPGTQSRNEMIVQFPNGPSTEQEVTDSNGVVSVREVWPNGVTTVTRKDQM